MLAVILVIVIGTVRLIGTNANLVFSQVGSAMTPP
jgi:Flp pilus assembly pilin Flp